MTSLVEARAAVLDDRELGGRELCRTLSAATDRALRELFEAATAEVGPHGLALVATGGHGRGELAPGSDLDLLLVHERRLDADVALVADRLWYPVWDAGLKLGHAVRSVRETLALAAHDLDTATAVLSARPLAGDGELAEALAERGHDQWRARWRRWLVELEVRIAERHHRADEVAFLLEPDVKVGRGGLRDVAALRWAEAARAVLVPGDAEALADAEDDLLAVRVELQRGQRRPSDTLLLERQDEVAATLGWGDADALMARVAAAARTIAWTSDEAWGRVASSLQGPSGRVAHRDHSLGGGLVVREGEVHLEAVADAAGDGALVVRAAAAAARLRTRIDRPSLDRFAAEAPVLDGPWPTGALDALVELLATGRHAIPVLEAIDQRRLVERVLPEWAHTRSRPQRNALHRFTVDRHLNEAAAWAATLVDRVDRPDLLLVGAWLHDLGKGLGGDHSVVGADLLSTIAPRMGFGPEDSAVLVALVRHHLLLVDIATRRDLDDPAVVAGVASTVGSVPTLRLLGALTEADSRATNHDVWTDWKAGLVARLVERAARVLGVESPLAVPEPQERRLRDALAGGAELVEPGDDRLLVVASDRAGLFSRVAGTLALRGLEVLAAEAESGDGGLAAFRFTVAPSDREGGHDWDRVCADLARALAGQLAIDARLAERRRATRVSAAMRVLAADPSVRVDDEASAESSVVEVHAPDAPGVLYRITRALAELDLDIRLARVATLGVEVVDVFYVRTRAGAKLDRDHAREVERAVLHQLSLV